MKERKIFIPTKKAKHHAPDIFDITNITQKKKSQPKKLQKVDSHSVQHIQANVEEIVINENDTEDDNEEHEEISLQSPRAEVYINKLGTLQNEKKCRMAKNKEENIPQDQLQNKVEEIHHVDKAIEESYPTS